MQKEAARILIQDTLEGAFDKEQFKKFIKEFVNHLEDAPFVYRGDYIYRDYRDSVKTLERIGKYEDADGKKIDVLIVHLLKTPSLERARSKQRNFIAKYLKGSRGNEFKHGALVAFVSPDEQDWRFSFVKMEYKFDTTKKGRPKVVEEFTPARRYSFLVGENENSHTAQSRLLPILGNTDQDPTLVEIEEAFSIEKVTKEFFENYRSLFLEIKDALDEFVNNDKATKADFEGKGVDTVDFAKKLLGQLVFLYFLQKKGWFGVARGKAWGTGPKNFLRRLFEGNMSRYTNFFNDILEPLFYEALAVERQADYYSPFKCKIPFLNGGLFDPLNDYDWVHTDILLPDELFSNKEKTKQGDIGTGVLDVFDRYNFTVKEDEPLEKEVAVDPEMLGKVFENLLEVKDRKSKGTYYTPREIVHYMCQESLVNYLDTELNDGAKRKDIETLIKHGESALENDILVSGQGEEKGRYKYKLPKSVRENNELIDQKLADIKVCDPAVGSGAFLVGMMSEIVRTRSVLARLNDPDDEPDIYGFKRDAIQDSLHGVDIDLGAVEIAKLRLWLSLIVDEVNYKHIKPLPNLDYKIMQGNSLLEEYEGIKLIDERFFEKHEEKEQFQKELKDQQSKLQREYFDLHSNNKLSATRKSEIEKNLKNIEKQLKTLEQPKTNGQDPFDMFGQTEAQSKAEKLLELHEQFFGAHHKSEKDCLHKKIDKLTWDLIETTLKKENKEDKLETIKRFQRTNTRPFFLWKLNFAEAFTDDGGFHIVIANPPYVNAMELKRTCPHSVLKQYKDGFESAKGAIDLYILFLECGSKLLGPKGYLSYITPNKYLSASYGKAFRKYCLDNLHVERFVDLSRLRVFKEASVYPILTFLSKSSESNHVETLIPVSRQLECVQSQDFHVNLFPKQWLSSLPDHLWGFVLSDHFQILEKILAVSVPITNLARIQATSTAKEADVLSGCILNKPKDAAWPLVNTGTIDRFESLWGAKDLRNKGETYLTPYLLPCEHVSEYRRKMYSSPKLIFAKMAKRAEVVIDASGKLASINTNCAYELESEDLLLYLGGFCNSALFQFVYSEFFGGTRMSGGYYQYQAPQLRCIPVPMANDSQINAVAQLVRQRIALSADHESEQCSCIESDIDAIFFELCGLSQDEIEIVEGTSN